MKIKAHILEHFEGSDDPRAIQGGGGAGSRVWKTVTNSRYLIERYVALLNKKYDEGMTIQFVGEGR